MPGILIGSVLMAYVMAYARVKRIPITEPARWRNIAAASRNDLGAAGAHRYPRRHLWRPVHANEDGPGGLYLCHRHLDVHVRRGMNWRQLWQVTVNSAALIAQIMLIVSAAGAFAWLITTSGLPDPKLVEFVGGLGLSKWTLLLVINVVLLFVGSAGRPAGGDPDPHAAAHADRLCGRRRPDPFRHHRHRRSRYRHVHAAV